ncbi:MAG: hypothetical protein V2I47_07510 [Bacteroidales bacterium]|jgi:hypothetical protein|nr:hypothetical protein [Bacteroidales bacterium]
MRTAKTSATILVIAILLAFALPAGAQERPQEGKRPDRKEMGERIQASKIAFITEKVELTPEEAEEFWPVYNQLEDKKMEVTEDIMKRFRPEEEKMKEPSEEEAAEMMAQRFKMEQQLLDLKVEYHKKFMDILPATKVAKLYRAEDQFKRGLMERFRHHDGERSPQGKGVSPPYRGRMMHR